MLAATIIPIASAVTNARAANNAANSGAAIITNSATNNATNNATNTNNAITIITDNKKKPGRPRKSTTANASQVYGVCSAPLGVGNAVEFIYFNSSNLKKTLTLFKSYNCSTIIISFGATAVTWFGIDHHEKVHVYLDVNCSVLNRYYCRNPIIITASRDDLEFALNIISKSCEIVTFIMFGDIKTQLLIHIKDTEQDITEKFELPVQEVGPNSIMARPNCANYPIHFKLTSKGFKDRVSNMNKGNVKTMLFQKIRAEPFQISCTNSRVNWAGVHNNGQNIAIESRLTDNDIFNVAVETQYVYDFTNNVLGTKIEVHADRHQRLSLTTVVDEYVNSSGIHTPILSVSVFIEIANYTYSV